jgi:hypothetical protein
MTKYIVLPLEEYTELVNAAATPPVPTPSPPPATGGLAAAVGLLTAKLAGIPAVAQEFDADPAAVIRALVVLCTTLLGHLLPDSAQGLLTDLGLSAQDEPGSGR